MSPGSRERLRDGSRVLIRPIEPADRDQLRAGFARLSDRTRYLRFQAPLPNLTERQLSYLSDVDHHNHEALLAVDPRTDDAVGVARFVRVNGDVAECAIVVADDWQGRGLGTLLLDRLAERAREEDVYRFTALVLAENADAIRVLGRLGDTEKRSLGSQVELDIALPEEDGAGVPLRSLLRGAASGAFEPAISMWRVVADSVYRRQPPAREHANALVVHAQSADPESAVMRVAAGLGSARGAHLYVVDSYWPLLSEREKVEQRLEQAADYLRGRRLEATVCIRGGDPVDAIVDVAQETAAAMIVVAPGAPGALMPWLLHSLPDRVCARAPCEVLIAR